MQTNNSKKIILSLCPGTGAMSKNYKENGYFVIPIEIKDGHDVRLLQYMDVQVYGILAEPPCTHLAGSGARWWKEKGEEALLEALQVVDACLRAVVIYKPKFWCLENPVGRLSKYLGKPKMYYQPYEYAGYLKNPETDLYTKKTCLWGDFNIPAKKSMKPLLGSKMHKLPPSKNRSQLRSITPGGFAYAFFLDNQ